MYSRFKINKSAFENFTFSSYDGSATQEEWFPTVKADIFLSHSHKDLDRANELAGWIKNKFGLDVFVDSNIII